MFTIHYTKENYNPYKTYARNANRYAGTKWAKTLEEAKEIAKGLKDAGIYDNTGKRVA